MARTNRIMNRYRSYLGVILALFISNLFAQHTWVDSISVAGNPIRMKVNHKTGVPNRVAGLVVNFNRYGAISENNVQGLSKSFLSEYARC